MSGEIRSPFHLVRCAIELGKMAIAEQLYRINRTVDDAMDVWSDPEYFEDESLED